MLVVNRLTHDAGGRTILRDISFVANAGRPLGLVGPNGSGKTTLLRLIAGEEQPRAGRIELPPGTVIGYLRQGHRPAPGLSAGAMFPLAFGAQALEARLAALGEAMATATGPELDALAAAYDATLQRLATPARLDAAALRDELGIAHVAPSHPALLLSGGELTKLAAIEVALLEPTLLLLDEPTNHLDIHGIAWVERWIERFPGTVVFVSHDRALLDRCAAQVLALDPRTGRGEVFTGGYTACLEQLQQRETEQWAAYECQRRHEERLKSVISAVESRSRGIENSTINFAIRKKAAKIARRAVTLRARLERELAAESHIERPAKPVQAFDGAFAAADAGSTLLAWANDLAIAVGGRVLAEGLTFAVRRGDRFVITGPNGSGKTTLLRTLLGELPPAGGEFALAGSARPGILPQVDPAEREAERRTPVAIIRAERQATEAEANNLLHHYLFDHAQLHTPLADLSYGERRRFALARLVLTGANLLFLDEPANHLDLPSREAFEAALAAFPGAAIIVSHDRYFIERFATLVLEL